jgi:hypothetical protein
MVVPPAQDTCVVVGLVCAAVMVFGAAASGAATSVRAAGAGPPVDGCGLLSDEDIRKVHGQPVHQRVPSAPPARRFSVSQCVYRTADQTHSISVAVTAPLAAAPPGTVRAYWKERFVPSSAGVSRKEEPPRAVSGIGDEAYWVGDRIAGAMYILKGDVIVRLSVGGIREEAPRLERTKALAHRIVERLPEGIGRKTR